jgi:P2 family phage contractile tail tube protein
MRDILQYMGLFVDGRGYFGEAKKVELPKIAIATRDFTASGMAGPIKVRMSRLANALEMKLTFDTMPVDLYDLFSVSEGEEFPFRVKGSVQGADGTIRAHEIVARGFVEEFDEGSWEDGAEAPLGQTISLRHYERHIDGVEKWVVNPEGMIIRRNGVDLLAQHRANIGR